MLLFAPVLVTVVAAIASVLISLVKMAVWMAHVAFLLFVCNAVVSIAASMCDGQASCFRSMTDKTESCLNGCFNRCAFAKMKATEEVHPGIVCDRSGMSPIVGARYTLRGHDYDLCAGEYAKLDAREKALYQRIPAPAYRRVAPPPVSPTAASPPTARTSPVEPSKESAAPAKQSNAPAKESNVAAHPGRVRRVDLSSVSFVDKTDEAVTVAVAAPGVATTDLDVRVLGQWLTLKGETTRDGATFIVDLKLALPANVDPESAHATHAHGEVTIMLKRKAGTRIPIRHLARGDGQRHLVAEAAVAPIAKDDAEVREPAEGKQLDVTSEAEGKADEAAEEAAAVAPPKADSSEEEEEWVPLGKEEKKVQ